MSIELATPTAAEHLAAIRERIQSRCATAVDFIAYNLLRGKPAYQGFRPWTNPARLAQGQGPYDGFLRASQTGAWTADQMPKALSDMLDERQRSQLRQDRVKLLCETFRLAQAQGLSRTAASLRSVR